MNNLQNIGKTVYSLHQFPQITPQRKRRVLTGIRPFRSKGIRLEKQQYQNKIIVHNYGHGGAGVCLSPATAIEAVDLAVDCNPKDNRVGILGSGVIGLTTALQSIKRGLRVRVYAERVPKPQQKNEFDMITSQIAPGYWNPRYYDYPCKQEHLKRAAISYKIFEQWQKQFQSIFKRPVFIQNQACAIFKNLSQQLVNSLEKHVVQINNKQFEGTRFYTYQIHLQNFLQELIDKIKEGGGQFVEKKFEEKKQVLEIQENVVINCLGLGSKKVMGDESVYGVKGMLIEFENNSKARGIFMFSNCCDIYCHDDKVLFGFYAKKDAEDRAIDEQALAEIQKNAYQLYNSFL